MRLTQLLMRRSVGMDGIGVSEGRTRRGALLAVFLLALGLGVGVESAPSPASAYTLTGCKFSSSTIPYLVSGLPTGYDLTSARGDWTVNTDVAGWTTSTIAARADFRFAYYGNVGWTGATSAGTCPGRTNHSLTVSIRTNRTYTDSYSVNKRISVMSHEIGHALGLNHNNTSSPCTSVVLMNGYDDQRFDSCGVYRTKSDDRAGANSLY